MSTRDGLREALLLRAEELHVDQNGSGLPLKGYSDCHSHIFETCTSPKCVAARAALAADAMSTRDGLRDVLNKWDKEIKTLLAQGNRAQAEQIQAVLVSIELALAAAAPASPPDAKVGEQYPGQAFFHKHNKNIADTENRADAKAGAGQNDAESLAEFLHERITAAENSALNDPEEKFCEDCLGDAKRWLAARAVVGQGSDALRSLRELSGRVAHEKDLSGVQGFHGQVMFINSADYPCKTDCVRCGLDAALAAFAPVSEKE